MSVRFHTQPALRWREWLFVCWFTCAGTTLISWADELAVAQPLRHLLEITSAQGKTAVTEAGRRFEVARGVAPQEPRVPYAYGLVLANLHQAGAAQKQFAAALATDMPPYPPAWRAGIALGLQQRQWLPTADLAERFGRVLVDFPDAWSVHDEHASDARWLGTATATAQSLVAGVVEVQRWLQVDAQLRKLLPPALQVPYRAGFDEMLDQHAKLSAELEAARAVAREDQELQQMTDRERVLDQKRLTENSLGQSKVIAAGQEKSFEEQMVEFGKQLGTLEREWNRLSTRRQAIQRSILLVEQEIYLLRQQLEILTEQNQQRSGQNRTTVFRPNLEAAIDNQIGVRVAQLWQYQAEDGRTLSEMVPVQRRAMNALAERQTATVEHERRTGELVARDEQLEKWKQQLEKKVVALDIPAKGLTPAVKLLEQQLQNPGTYLPLNWNAERQRVLQELAGK